MKKNNLVRRYLILLIVFLVIIYLLIKLDIVRDPGVKTPARTDNSPALVTSPSLDSPTDGLPGPRPN